MVLYQAEVSRKVSRSSVGRDNIGVVGNVEKLEKEVGELETATAAMVLKMKAAMVRLNELEVETDLKLRQDLIDMESRFKSLLFALLQMLGPS